MKITSTGRAALSPARRRAHKNLFINPNAPSVINHHNANAAFSLIEVMVAMLILGIGLVGLVHGLDTALASHKESEIRTQAALLAAGQIEALRADGFVTEGDFDGEFDGDLSNYSWKESVKPSTPEGLYEVTVTIEKDSEEIYELKTMLFDPPVIREESDQEKKERDRKKRSQ
jgi:prepilin-type N-terminal cleavage/methylation domain-containing protein